MLRYEKKKILGDFGTRFTLLWEVPEIGGLVIISPLYQITENLNMNLDFFYYYGFANVDDNKLRELMIDRIYDTFIDEADLRFCDMTINKIADSLEPRAYSSREFIYEMGKYLDENRHEPCRWFRNNIPYRYLAEVFSKLYRLVGNFLFCYCPTKLQLCFIFHPAKYCLSYTN